MIPYVVRVNSRVVYRYEGQMTGTEDWITHTIDLSSACGRCRRIRVVIQATGQVWDLFDTYGQLAVDEVELLGCR